MVEGHNWVGSTIEANRKQNVSNWEAFKPQVRLSLYDCGDV